MVEQIINQNYFVYKNSVFYIISAYHNLHYVIQFLEFNWGSDILWSRQNSENYLCNLNYTSQKLEVLILVWDDILVFVIKVNLNKNNNFKLETFAYISRAKKDLYEIFA